MSILEEWAKREIEIACERENPNRKKGEWDYGCACYESAYKAFESLCHDGHSGMSIKFTQAILNRLIDGKALTPIVDEDFFKYPTDIKDSEEELKKNGLKSNIQCGRMSSLFRRETLDGKVTYRDVERVSFHDANGDGWWYDSTACKLIDERFPITMPYSPSAEPYKVYGETKCLDENGNDVTKERRGEFNYTRYDYVVTPKGERIELNVEWREGE